MRAPVLIVLHSETSTPGRIGHMLVREGLPLDIRRPCLGDDLPETLAQHAGAAIFGGPMSANDPDDWIAREIDWIGVPLKEEKPFLGICLGAQMLAKHLGGKVGPHPEGLVEIGYYPLSPTERGTTLAPGRSMSTTGIAKASRSPQARSGSPRATPSRTRRSATAARLRHPVPPGGDAAHHAPLGRDRRASLRPARRAGRPRPSRRQPPA